MERQHLNQTKKAIAPPQNQSHASDRHSPHPIEELQGAIGNQAVNQLLANQPVLQAKPMFKGLSGELRSPIQAKLTIGAPRDRYEQEADRISKQVVNQINAPASQSSTQSQSIQRQERPEEDDELQIRPVVQRLANEDGGASAANLETSIQQARGSGNPLAHSIQQSMEGAFGAEFSGVRVHADATSDRLNQSIQAKAFTTGQDVFFRQGTYAPGSREGQELIAHELTHVVQQTGDSAATIDVSHHVVQCMTIPPQSQTYDQEISTENLEKFKQGIRNLVKNEDKKHNKRRLKYIRDYISDQEEDNLKEVQSLLNRPLAKVSGVR